MFILAGILILFFFTLTGFLVWSASALPLAIREIAINSRQGKIRGSAYNLLRGLSIIIKISAGVIWLVGALLSYALATPLGLVLEALITKS